VLLKKKLINELEDEEEMPDNCSKDRVGIRSPFDKFNPGTIIIIIIISFFFYLPYANNLVLQLLVFG